MASWSIEIERESHGYTWKANSSNDDFIYNDFWQEGVFISEDAALSEAMRQIHLYEVKETKRSARGTSYYAMETNG